MNKCEYDAIKSELIIGNELFSKLIPNVTNVKSEQVKSRLSEPYLKITAERNFKKNIYCIWDNLPVIHIIDCNEDELEKLNGEHWHIKAVKLNAFTDECDTLTVDTEHELFQKNLYECYGEIFFLENIENGDAVVIISETPDYQTTTMSIKAGAVKVDNGGNPITVGYCRSGECEALCRNYYRHAKKCEGLVTMSNTWGDCNGFSRVCEDFVLKEIDVAEEIGVDIVQIDDGWQTGNTADKSLRDELNRRIFNGDFWELDSNKFPKGMKHITDYAAEKSIKVGMWFAPDSHDEYALLERDINVLKKAYNEWGIRFFKLDMYWIMSNTEKDCFLKLLNKIHSFGDDVSVQLDVTRNLRINYLCGHKYGTVFVENRYTKSANSFPHRVLRNLWMISKYIPSSKFQFELINPDLNKECYGENDPFAPALYDMDYLFATVMLSNPLFWMEMQYLSDERKTQLKKIMNVWKEHRVSLANADVMPIGDKPSGRSFTGFYISNKGKPEYLLLFREVTEENSTMIKCPVKSANIEILATNSHAEVEINNGFINAKFSKPRSYAFIKIL